MLYTIVPEEIIMRNEPDIKKTDTILFDGAIIEGVKNGNIMMITRVISSDPAHYLNSSISPGRYIKIN